MALRLLLLEENEHLRHLSQKALKNKGFTCDTAKTTLEAYLLFIRAHSDSRPFHALILDLHFSRDSAFRLVQSIRHFEAEYAKIQKDRFVRIRIIGQSSNPRLSDQKCRECGVDFRLSQLGPQALLAAITHALFSEQSSKHVR